MPTRELWQFANGRSRAIDVDALYGPGTVSLQARLEALVLLNWTVDGTGFHVRRLGTQGGLDHWPIYYKNLGVFDLDRDMYSMPTEADLAGYREILGKLKVIEVSGRPDFAALAEVVADLMAG
jgi:hypothetical protein